MQENVIFHFNSLAEFSATSSSFTTKHKRNNSMTMIVRAIPSLPQGYLLALKTRKRRALPLAHPSLGSSDLTVVWIQLCCCCCIEANSLKRQALGMRGIKKNPDGNIPY